MFRVWLEDLIELNYLQSNKLTRTMQNYYCGSIYFHSSQYNRFAFYLD